MERVQDCFITQVVKKPAKKERIYGFFPWENVLAPPQKPWLWTEKTRWH